MIQEIQPKSTFKTIKGSEASLWYKDAVIYELRTRSFYDSDDDGVGDLRGLTEKLDYLSDLGITAIWILPHYPSPGRDDGYDISDYTDVQVGAGTLDDFRAFVEEAHRRGIRVITELVVNHTSDQHPWFQRARRALPGSAERNFYVWSDTKPVRGSTDHIQRVRTLELDMGSCRQSIFLAPIFFAPAGSQLRQPGGARSCARNRRLLAPARC